MIRHRHAGRGTMPTNQTVDAFEVLGRTTVRAADGAFLRLAEQENAVTGTLDPETTARVLSELDARRRTRTAPLAGRTAIGVVAPGMFSRELRTLAEGGALQFHTITQEDAEKGAAGPGLLLHLATAPRERDLLDHLPASGTAVLRCYREGDILLIDPLRLDAGDPSARQLLRRRLAASPAPTELEAWLARQEPDGDVFRGLSAAAVALFLSRLVSVIAAWQHGADALESHRRVLWRLDTATLLVSEHPVLPYPEPAVHPGRAR